MTTRTRNIAKTATLFALLVFVAAPALAIAQDAASGAPSGPKPPDHFYKLNMTVEELNDAGQPSNSRTYSAIIETGPGSQEIRTGSRVPIATGTEGGGTNVQFQYIDVGVNVDVRKVEEIGDKLSFTLVADVSSIAPMEKMTGQLAGEPVIRQNKWNSSVLIPIGKPIVVFSADDLVDKGRMQVQVTATRVD